MVICPENLQLSLRSIFLYKSFLYRPRPTTSSSCRSLWGVFFCSSFSLFLPTFLLLMETMLKKIWWVSNWTLMNCFFVNLLVQDQPCSNCSTSIFRMVNSFTLSTWERCPWEYQPRMFITPCYTPFLESKPMLLFKLIHFPYFHFLKWISVNRS